MRIIRVAVQHIRILPAMFSANHVLNLPICFICISTKHKPHDMEELSDVLKDFGSRIQNESRIMNLKIKPTYRKILAQMKSILFRVPLRYHATSPRGSRKYKEDMEGKN